jgi:hypothetical protein
MAESETSVETSVMPGRNGGTLRAGGGNPQRNGGRPKNEIRAAAMVDFEAAMPLIRETALNLDHPHWKTAIDTLVKVAGLQQTDVTSNDKAIETLRVVFEDEPKRGE